MTDAPKRINETAQLLRLMAGVFQMDPRNKALILRAADELDAQADIADDLLEALENISEPVEKLQEQALDDGCDLDGVIAMRLADDPHYLRQIARAAIARAKE